MMTLLAVVIFSQVLPLQPQSISNNEKDYCVRIRSSEWGQGMFNFQIIALPDDITSLTP